ncbi:MAG TPA: kelch repeat-containing protein [Candidatus Limnocylindrales bacterium]|nr:kelch repeat-containing protein [Candidatus Limnocylindrales bacterium]
MTRTVRLLLLSASPILLGACAVPFISSSAPGPPANPVGAYGHEARTVSPAFGPGLALLPDGRVVAAGGSGSRGAVADAEIYDPTSSAWSALPGMPVARGQATATTLADGSVLVAGGLGASGEILATGLLFHPGGAWTPTGSLSAPRYGQTALPLKDGRVLLVGGWSQPSSFGQNALPTRAIDRFDPSTRRFAPGAAAPAVVQGAMFASLPDGRVLMAGGDDPAHGSTSRVWLYDPSADTWTPGPPMPVSRAYGIAITLAGGQVLVAGGDQMAAQPGGVQTGPIQPGVVAQGPPLTTAVLYDPTANAWSRVADAPPGINQAFGGALLLHDGRAVTFGLNFSGGPTADLSAIFYDPATGKWSTGAPVPVTVTGGLSPVLLQSGRVLLVLGSTSLVFDPEATAPAPPQAPVHPLASPRLTPWLLVIAAILLMVLIAQYAQAQLRSRRRTS